MYEVYALKYAERDTTKCQFFYRESSHETGTGRHREPVTPARTGATGSEMRIRRHLAAAGHPAVRLPNPLSAASPRRGTTAP